jgi:hypothetical protein
MQNFVEFIILYDFLIKDFQNLQGGVICFTNKIFTQKIIFLYQFINAFLLFLFIVKVLTLIQIRLCFDRMLNFLRGINCKSE